MDRKKFHWKPLVNVGYGDGTVNSSKDGATFIASWFPEVRGTLGLFTIFLLSFKILPDAAKR